MHKKITYIIYQVLMALLAIASIVMLIAYYANEINIDAYPYDMFDNWIWLIFFTDYVVRLVLADNKRRFIRENIFDLLSIIPASSIFYFFRIAQIGRTLHLLKLLRIMRLVGLAGRLGSFFERSEFLYYLYISIAVIIITSAMFCISEKSSFNTAIWWAVTTATTIGYGDVVPKTGLGRIAAIILMLLGISFIGMLTSMITEFFSKKDEQELADQLKGIREENKQLKAELDEIKELLKNKE
ncbi:ion channel [Limosilactobacillus caccae]|uniref:ion channel n=1 Tax=Limosilactobacillus caccae TaxID=1926284 RepID=UPI000970A3A4|nr:ion channel [Limosilactobacillus caccae]